MFFRTPGYEDLELSTQILIKEALGRGIKVDVLDRKDNFIRLTREDKIEYIKQASRTSADNYIVPLIMENKIVTKKLLVEKGISTPGGGDYSSREEAEAEYGRYKDRNIVVKPNSTNYGKGITILKTPFTRESLSTAIAFAFEKDSVVLIEEFIRGKEYRFLVIDDYVVAVLHRVPANITGNGTHSIRELVKEKNRDPLRGKGHVTPLEKISMGETEIQFLRSQDKDFDYIPALGEQIFLRKNSNISTGGDSIDYTDEMPISYKDIAVKAVQTVKAKICGLDMIVKDYGQEAQKDNYSIIELNFNPALHIHTYPYKGKSHHGAKHVLDLLGF